MAATILFILYVLLGSFVLLYTASWLWILNKKVNLGVIIAEDFETGAVFRLVSKDSE